MPQPPKKPTKAERKEDARKRRMEELKRRHRQQRNRRLVYSGIALLAIAGLVLIVMQTQKADREKKLAFDKFAKIGGCEDVQHPKDQGNNNGTHIVAPQKYNYNSNPPTSGPHYAPTVPTGISSTEFPNENQVHNLEHGHVIIQYKKSLDPAIVTALSGFVTTDNRRLILAPREDMPSTLAFTGWGTLLPCNKPVKGKIVTVAERFFAQFRGRGPEGDQPGRPSA